MRRRSTLALLCTLAAAALALPAAAEHPSCAFTPELRQRLLELDPQNSGCELDTACLEANEQEARALLAKYPGQVWVARLIQQYEERKTIASGKRGALLEPYQAAAAAAPQDPVAQYLWGRQQVANGQPGTGFERALALDPALPIAQLALASSLLNADPAKRDEARAGQLIESFVESCPARTFDAMQLLMSWPDGKIWLPLMARLRASLPSRPPLERVLSYLVLWGGEFKVKNVAEHEALRAQVVQELKDLEGTGLQKSPLFWEALRLGTEVTGGEPETVDRRQAEFFPCQDGAVETAQADLRRKAGLSALPYDRVVPTPEQNRQLLEGYKELVARCPKDPFIRLEMLYSLSDDPKTSKEELIANAEKAAAAFVERRGLTFSPRPATLSIAEILVNHQAAPGKAIAILGEARLDFESFKARRAAISANQPPNPESAARMKGMIGGTESLFNILEARARLQLGETAKAAELLEAAHQLLIDAGTGVSGQAVQQFGLARKDLLAAAPTAKAPPELAAPAAAAPPEGNWKTVDLPFEGLPLENPKGGVFKVEDLAGKVWLVNLWATWCGPCMVELPHIQKLYEELKDRPDVGILTLNFDFENGKVQPFLDRKGYTFPVLLAGKGLEKYTKEGIPQNWLVDGQLKVRRKSTGFDPAHPEIFIQQVKEGLDQLKTP